MPDLEAPANNGITLEKSEHLKGIAIILLMWHHLFGVGYIDDWLSLNRNADIMLGVAGRICLGIFLFCSGFGLYKSYISRKSVSKTYLLKRISSVCIPYWMVMIIAIICLLFLGKFTPQSLIANIFCWVHDENLYVSFAWYIKLYMLIIFVLPLIRKIEEKWKKNPVIDIALYVVLPVIYYCLFYCYKDEAHFKSVASSLFSSSILFASGFPLFTTGLLFAKYNVYEKIQAFTNKLPRACILIISFLVCGCVVYFRNAFNYYGITDVIYAPLTSVSLLTIIDNVKFKSKFIIPYLGKKSVFYWLLSSMFFINTSELLFLITWPRVSVLIEIWMLVILTPFVYACDLISNKIIVLLFKNIGSNK